MIAAARAGEGIAALHERMKAAAEVARLPMRSGLVGGAVGGVLGQGTGSSLDFQDHRLYAPGDDPRHINWQAYARTGHYTMKLYREEISPRVDLLIDGSASMFLDETKAKRSWELVYFCVESALRLGAALRCHDVSGASPLEIEIAQLLGHCWTPVADAALDKQTPSWSRAPLRPASLRVVISDLLFEAEPSALIAPLLSGKGRAVLLAPFCAAESAPDWDGNIEFEDCENRRADKRRVTPDMRARYDESYRAHFTAWREACGRRAATLARVPAEGDFLTALRAEAVACGALEM